MPSMIYGLFKTSDIIWFCEKENIFDWFDCYFALKIILQFNGFAISERFLYTAGVANQYEFKPTRPLKGKIFSYKSYLLASLKTISTCNLSMVEKVKLASVLLEVNSISFLDIEKSRKNYKWYLYAYRLYHVFVPYIPIRKHT
jgi:hypothetical protein